MDRFQYNNIYVIDISMNDKKLYSRCMRSYYYYI